MIAVELTICIINLSQSTFKYRFKYSVRTLQLHSSISSLLILYAVFVYFYTYICQNSSVFLLLLHYLLKELKLWKTSIIFNIIFTLCMTLFLWVSLNFNHLRSYSSKELSLTFVLAKVWGNKFSQLFFAWKKYFAFIFKDIFAEYQSLCWKIFLSLL